MIAGLRCPRRERLPAPAVERRGVEVAAGPLSLLVWLSSLLSLVVVVVAVAVAVVVVVVIIIVILIVIVIVIVIVVVLSLLSIIMLLMYSNSMEHR